MSIGLVPAFIGQAMPDEPVATVQSEAILAEFINHLSIAKPCELCGMRKRPMTANGLKRFPANLTPQERRTVVLLCMGLQNKQIAAQMDTTEQVVKNRMREIFVKVGCTDRAQLLIRMMKFKYEGA